MNMTSSLVDYWEECAEEWDRIQGDSGDRLRRLAIYPWLLSKLRVSNDGSLLDVGCGNGSFSRVAARLGARTTAIDHSRALLELAAHRSSELDIHYILRSCEQLPEAVSHKYSAAVCNFTLQDVWDPRRVVEGIGKVLAPGGDLAIVIESEESLRSTSVHTYRRETVIPAMMADAAGHPAQRIYWYEGHYTYTFVRPEGFYLQLLEETRFEVTAVSTLSQIMWDAEPALAIDGKIIGLHARKR